MLAEIARTGLVVFTVALAYGQTGERSLTFDVASVKPAASPVADGRGMIRMAGPSGGPGTKEPGRIHYPYMSLKNLLMTAYDVKNFQIVGPSWLDTERFDITATMPPDTTREQFHVMLQNLLAERFKLTLHRETKELPMFVLVVAKNGPKMKESAEVPPPKEGDDAAPLPPPPSQPKMGPDGFPIIPGLAGRAGLFGMMMASPNGPPRARWIASQQTMQDLANRLTNQMSRPVTDATGLKAKYDFTLTFAPEPMTGPMGPPGPGGGVMVSVAPPAPAPPGGAAGGGGAPPASQPEAEPLADISAALQAQLGIKLEPKKGPVELIVIDHVEKTPTEN
ncbi:MAG: TIGR03435 family protein [Bryobacteraceae bacterium]